MDCNSRTGQRGFSLLLMVVTLMTVAGVVAAGYTQSVRKAVEVQRFESNKRVLQEAKQALLQYAYNYPRFNAEGPGRLPCPDTDNDGLPGVPGPPALTLAICQSVGRFPWLDPSMNFYDARDASGARLWYAVSDNFYNLGGGPVINSNSTGNITIFDQNQGLLYNGLVEGIAAIIIAPGAAIARDEDNNGSYEYTQVRATGPQQLDPRNYLDTFGLFDNSVFDVINNSVDDGFILGPVFDPVANTYIVNDQVIIVTADEVTAMAEKATLEVYRDAVNDYRNNTGGTYPWLDSYASLVTPADLLTNFDADIGSFRGRMPAVFSSYFNGQQVDQYTSQTKIRMELPVLAPAPGGVIIHTPAVGPGPVSFDAGGDLVTTLNSTYNVTRYFWDGHPTQPNTLPMDGVWEMCPDVLGTEDDCNQDVGGNFVGMGGIIPGESDVWLQVYRLTITLDQAPNPPPLKFSDGDLISAGPYAYIPATAGEQAYVFGNYSDNVATTSIAINWQYDQDFKSSFTNQAAGNLTDAAIGVVYYPELPDWALSDRWHHSIQMAIAEDYKPDGNNTDCTVTGCLVINNLGGTNNDKISLLAIAGEVDDLVDDGAAGFSDDLQAQFAAENDISNPIYDRRAENDKVLVLQ